MTSTGLKDRNGVDIQEGDSRESRMVVIERDEAGTPTVWCDPEIVDLVTALNKGGIPTVASCSGHGVIWGNIALRDGRELFIAPDFEAARAFERAGMLPEGVVMGVPHAM